MKKTTLVLCSSLLLVGGAGLQAQQAYDYWLASPVDYRLGWVSPIETQIVKGVPYSAEIVTEFVQTLSDGNRIVQRKTARVYRDGQGRIRREDDLPGGAAAISILDAVAGTAFTLDPAKRVARETSPLLINSGGTQPLFHLFQLMPFQKGYSGATTDTVSLQAWAPRARATRAGADPAAAPSDEKLPDRVIEGVLATGTRRTTTIEKGAIGNEQPIKIVSEEWRSPELQILVLTDLNDPRAGRSTYRLLKISRLEPDAALFQIPSDYTISRLPAGGRGRGRGGS
jgi:hypothetical protein